jgi:hypothetical protein
LKKIEEKIMARTTNPGHLTKNMSMEAFGAFAAYLVKYIKTGLPEEECQANKIWLREMAAVATTLPDANMWGKTIAQRCDAVADEYDNWNKPGSTPESRDKYHQRLKKKINKLAATFRVRTALLEKQVGIGIYSAVYKATENLILAFPSILLAVAEAIAKYPRPPLNPPHLKTH